MLGEMYGRVYFIRKQISCTDRYVLVPGQPEAIPPPFFNILSKVYSIAICHSSMSYLPPLSGKQKNARQIKILDEFIIFILLYKTHPKAELILLSVNTFRPKFCPSIHYFYA